MSFAEDEVDLVEDASEVKVVGCYFCAMGVDFQGGDLAVLWNTAGEENGREPTRSQQGDAEEPPC